MNNSEKERKSGVLMNISSLPGPFGIGVFGEEAGAFAQKLKAMGFSYWQILPLGTLDRGNSPYCGDSAFAGNELYVDPRELRKDGLLSFEDVEKAYYRGSPFTCDYEYVRNAKNELLRKAFAAYKNDPPAGMREEFSVFLKEEPWAITYAAYRATKDKNQGRPWYEWPGEYVENPSEVVGNLMANGDKAAAIVGNIGENGGKGPENSELSGSQPTKAGGAEKITVGNFANYVGNSPDNVGNPVENVGKVPAAVGNPAENVGNNAAFVGSSSPSGSAARELFTEQDRANAEYYAFAQFLFARQWKKLKAFINEAGIKIIGDMPLYVAYDSCDVWAFRDLFCLENDGRTLSGVAGVPPDYFSEEGQLWGNPLYDWEAMEKDGYSWWKLRVSAAMKCYDVLRIDHFRGLASFWRIPGGERSAVRGEWRKGPGTKLFESLKSAGVYGEGQIIAEDLGVFGEDVEELLEATGFAGMKVVQFGFDGSRDSLNLPHKYAENTVAYTGTHDNNTLLGWLYEAAPEERAYALDYCGFKGDWTVGGREAPSVRAVIETVMRTASKLVIIPLQDLCGFGRDARMNIPGEPAGNWRYRADKETIDNIDAAYFYGINRLFSRL